MPALKKFDFEAAEPQENPDVGIWSVLGHWQMQLCSSRHSCRYEAPLLRMLLLLHYCHVP